MNKASKCQISVRPIVKKWFYYASLNHKANKSQFLGVARGQRHLHKNKAYLVN